MTPSGMWDQLFRDDSTCVTLGTILPSQAYSWRSSLKVRITFLFQADNPATVQRTTSSHLASCAMSRRQRREEFYLRHRCSGSDLQRGKRFLISRQGLGVRFLP